MYAIVLLAATASGAEAPGFGKGRPTPYHGMPGMGHYGYNGGYHLPGYACWGGCGGYASPAYGFPMSPIVTPPAKLPYYYEDPDNDDRANDRKSKNRRGDKDRDDRDDREEKNRDDKGRKAPKADPDDDDVPKAKKPKKPKKEDPDDKTSARVTFLLPAGAKLSVDGRPYASGETTTFRTPALEAGRTYYYEVKAEVTRDGKPVAETRRLPLRAGGDVEADFRDLGVSAAVSAE